MSEPPGRPGHGMRRNPEAKGRCGAISGQWAYWPVSGNRNFHDRLGKLGPRLGVKIAPRFPRVFSPFVRSLGRSPEFPKASKSCAWLRHGFPRRGPDQAAPLFFFSGFSIRVFPQKLSSFPSVPEGPLMCVHGHLLE